MQEVHLWLGLELLKLVKKMNKYQKALDDLQDYHNHYHDDVSFENYKLLKELVEKATPKKPIEKPSFASGYKCPNCECNIVLHGSHEICPTPHCSWCGQALDWNEEDVD